MNLNYTFVKNILDAVFLTDTYASQLNKPTGNKSAKHAMQDMHNLTYIPDCGFWAQSIIRCQYI